MPRVVALDLAEYMSRAPNQQHILIHYRFIREKLIKIKIISTDTIILNYRKVIRYDALGVVEDEEAERVDRIIAALQPRDELQQRASAITKCPLSADMPFPVLNSSYIKIFI